MSGKRVRIAGFSGFWGDSPGAVGQLLAKGGHIDYLIGDYLAEVTMCILARVKARPKKGGAGEGGYVADFIKDVLKPHLKEIMQRKIRVITNAGGMNPLALKKAIEDLAIKAGVPVPVVGCVTGDDLHPRAPQLREQSKLHSFNPVTASDEQEQHWPEGEILMSSNAYHGAGPIAKCLEMGAQIVVTGRCVDSALVLGPLMHEFGWGPTDFDLLSAGSLVGHVIECGCQCTGGNFTDWRESIKEHGWNDVGFPIAEVSPDGSFTVTKGEGTGGVVSVGSVGEQIVYEIGDPASYFLPDVICDWTKVKVVEVGKDVVKVSGAKGLPPSAYYKVGSTTVAGFKSSAMMMVTGFQAAPKAQAVAEALLRRVSDIFKSKGIPPFLASRIELLGADATYGQMADEYCRVSREVMLRVTVWHPSSDALTLFGTELAGFALSSAPGLTGTGLGAGRPKPTPCIKYYSSLVPKDEVPLTITVGQNDNTAFPLPHLPHLSGPSPLHLVQSKPTSALQNDPAFIFAGNQKSIKDPVVVPLIALCWARSGDKGDVANVGVICRREEYYDLVRRSVTAEAVKSYFHHFAKGIVMRYEMEGIFALNFVLTKALGGGGVSSLNIDSQGKSYGQKLLGMGIYIPREWVTTYNLMPLTAHGPSRFTKNIAFQGPHHQIPDALFAPLPARL